jgi:amino acid permease
MRNAGWLFGISCIVGSAVLTTICMLLLIEVRLRFRPGSFSDYAYESLGTPGLIIANLSLVVSQTSFVVVYVLFVIENTKALWLYFFGAELSIILLAVLAFLVYAPLTWVRKI